MRVGGAKLRLGLIGHGGIGETVARLAAAGTEVEVVAVLLRRPPDDAARFPAGVLVTTELAALRAAGCDLVAECAGHAAVRAHVPPLLAGGTDCVVASIGALADRATERALTDATAQGGTRLILPAGAVGGLDLIAAARFGSLSRVTYQSRKPPRAWRGTAAEAALDLSAVTQPTLFFHGSAREAALDYPQNANVAAAVALAGLGFDTTEVELWAVPGIAENRHAISVEGAFGAASIEIAGRPLPGNPKTSYLAALSVLRAVTNAAARIVI